MNIEAVSQTEETARLRGAWISLAEDAVPRDDCPDPERLWQAAHGDLPPGEWRGLTNDEINELRRTVDASADGDDRKSTWN